MPQYIEIAVVGADQKTVKSITKDAPVSQPGIAPKYHLVSLSDASSKRITKFSELNYDRVFVWVALDEESKLACEAAIKINDSRSSFERGFYNHHLPESLIMVGNENEFLATAKKIYEAFCATS
ncbi:hypothetical protein L2725_10935 [Shewanella corallii]|uniref:Uncharacterized protein n=1 Tax=Shewanella corallii TaxID=560080 RepID=A0ABT0N7C7_9GAMM|nr:hypothetical protein [Shewanella corallii]MCL2914282.1 hypothetical protein [Shewanella corallii]